MRRVPATVVWCLALGCARGEPEPAPEPEARSPLAAPASTDEGRALGPSSRAAGLIGEAPVSGSVAGVDGSGLDAMLRESSPAPHVSLGGAGRGRVTTFGGGAMAARGRGDGGAGHATRSDGGRAMSRRHAAATVARLISDDLTGGAIGEVSGVGGLGLRARGGARTARATGVPVNLPPLRAGATDDNDDLAGFIKYLAAWNALPEQVAAHSRLDVRTPRRLVVRDLDERPVPGAWVEVSDPTSGKVLFVGTTYGDGSVPFYPYVFATGAERARELRVRAQALGSADVVGLDPGSREPVYLYLDRAAPSARQVQLDVVFLLDTTGSMQDEIDRIKQTLRQVTTELRRGAQGVDLRYGAVLYRDRADDYVTSLHPLTPELDRLDDVLRAVQAGGGGDGPESLNQALAETVHQMSWRPGAARVVFLVADAPPHLDYTDDTPYGETLKDALAEGIRIHSVAASGLDELGSLVFRQIAQFTRGKFIFIEYGSVAASAAAHGVGGQVTSNNLDAIILQQLRREIAQWGRDDGAAAR